MHIYNKASRLKVLDTSGKVDRDLCYEALNRLKANREFEVLFQVMNKASQDRKAALNDPYFSQNHCLDTDEVFRIGN